MTLKIKDRLRDIAREMGIKNIDEENFAMLKRKEGKLPAMFIKLKTCYNSGEISTIFLHDTEGEFRNPETLISKKNIVVADIHVESIFIGTEHRTLTTKLTEAVIGETDEEDSSEDEHEKST